MKKIITGFILGGIVVAFVFHAYTVYQIQKQTILNTQNINQIASQVGLNLQNIKAIIGITQPEE